MRKSRKAARIRLYERGNNKCPICLKEFTREGVENGKMATLEHVPPKSLSVSSRWLCLTCSSCNQGAGEKIDRIAYELMKPPKATVSIKGVLHAGTIEIEEDNHVKVTATSALRIPMAELYGLTSDDFKMKVSFPNEHYGKVSWLKSGYLTLFSLLGSHGYRYAEGSVGTIIREQIMNPGERIIEKCIGNASDDWALEDGIFMHIDQPKLWVVKMGEVGVFLPRTGDDSLYRGIGQLKENFRFDFRNGYYWRVVRFGENIVGSFVVDDRSALDEKTGGDPFGCYARVKHKGKERHFVVADHGSDFLTVLLLNPESIGA